MQSAEAARLEALQALLVALRGSCSGGGIFNDEDRFVDAAEALQRMVAKDAANKGMVLSLGGVPLLAAPLMRGSVGEGALAAVAALQVVVRGNTPCKDALQQANAIPSLVAMLNAGPRADIAQEALQTLEDLTCGHEGSSSAVLTAKGAPVIVMLTQQASPGSNTQRQAIATLLNIASCGDRACTAVAAAGAGPMLLEVMAEPHTAKITRMAALDLLKLMTHVSPNRRNLDKMHPAQTLAEIGAAGALLGVIEASAISDGQSYETCTACDALEGIALIHGVLGEHDVVRLVNALYATLIGERTTRPLAGDEGRKEYVRTQHDVEVERSIILQRGQGVLNATLPDRVERVHAAEKAHAAKDANVFGGARKLATVAAASVESAEEEIAQASGGSAPPKADQTTGVADDAPSVPSDAVGSRVEEPPLDWRATVHTNVSKAERGLFRAASQLHKSGVGLSTIRLVLGEAYAPLLSIAASVLATSMASPGDVATTFHALPLARALFAESTAIGCSSTWEGALAEAERFLESRPEEVEPLVQIERSAATSSASMRRAAGRGSAAMKGAGVLLARRRASTAATS
jgi:hypothetical protein